MSIEIRKNFAVLHRLRVTGPGRENCGEDGMPKTTNMGGVERSDASGQSHKKPALDILREIKVLEEFGLPLSTFGVHRTVEMAKDVAARMTKMGCSPVDAEKWATDAVKSITHNAKKAEEKAEEKAKKKAAKKAKAEAEGKEYKDNDKEKEGEVPLLYSDADAEALAKALVEAGGKKIDVAKLLLAVPKNLGLAIGGRFVANSPVLNILTAVRCSHSISTHELAMSYDYRTCVDERRVESGAAHISSDVGFHSSCFYDCVVIDFRSVFGGGFVVPEGKEAQKALIRLMIFAFCVATPRGGQTAMFSATAPDYVLAVLTDRQPKSYVSAFDSPIVPVNGEGYLAPSIRRLQEKHRNASGFFKGIPGMDTVSIEAIEAEGEEKSLGRLMQEVSDHVIG